MTKQVTALTKAQTDLIAHNMGAMVRGYTEAGMYDHARGVKAAAVNMSLTLFALDNNHDAAAFMSMAGLSMEEQLITAMALLEKTKEPNNAAYIHPANPSTHH